MTSIWGTQPSIIEKIQIADEATELEHNKYYSYESTCDVFIPISWPGAIEQYEKDAVATAREKYGEEAAVTLVYAEVTVEDVGIPGFFYKLHTTYIIKANHPIAVITIIGICAGIALIIGAIIVSYGFFRLMVAGAEWAGGLGGVIMFIAVALIIAYVALGWGKK